MINQSTLDSMKAMRLTAMAAELERQLEDAATYRTLGFEERIGLLVDAEWNRRQANKLSRYIKNAHFAAPNATIEGIEYHEDRKLDKAEILRFATCQYIMDMYISDKLTILHGQSDHLSRRFRSLISERDSRRSKSFL